MGAKKLRVFAEALLLINELNAEQRADLLDVLRGRPQRASKAKPKEPKEPKAAKEKESKQPKLVAEPMCTICGFDEGFTDHYQPSPNYHPFSTGAKKKDKAAGATS